VGWLQSRSRAVRAGHRDEADAFYKKSATIIDALLKNVPTRNVEGLLLAEMGKVYAGYFDSTCSRYDDDQPFGSSKKHAGGSKHRLFSITNTLRPTRRRRPSDV